MKLYEFLDVLVARAWRSPANKDGHHYVKIGEDEIENLSEAAEELFQHDPESMREVPLGEDETDDDD